jgi:HEAT repeat protein
VRGEVAQIGLVTPINDAAFIAFAHFGDPVALLVLTEALQNSNSNARQNRFMALRNTSDACTADVLI